MEQNILRRKALCSGCIDIVFCQNVNHGASHRYRIAAYHQKPHAEHRQYHMLDIILNQHKSVVIRSRCRDSACREYLDSDAENENQEHRKPECRHGIKHQRPRKKSRIQFCSSFLRTYYTDDKSEYDCNNLCTKQQNYGVRDSSHDNFPYIRTSVIGIEGIAEVSGKQIL